MGALVGPGISTPLIMATKKQTTAALMSRPAAAECCCAVPMNSVEERLTPDDGENDETSGEGDEVLSGLTAERVTVIGSGFREAGDAKEMEVEPERHDHHGADQAEKDEQGQ